MRISIFGLGYVGAVSVGCLAALGHEIFGVDINSTKVAMINTGRSPVIEAGLDELIAAGVATGQIRAGTDAAAAIAATELSLVCVGTPSDPNGGLNLAAVERVCAEIGQGLAAKLRGNGTQQGNLPDESAPAGVQPGDYHTVVVRSTMLPGSMDARIIPALEQAAGLTAGQDFGVAYNPEFLREGSAVYDFSHPPYTVIGELDPRGADIAAQVYAGLAAPLLRTPLAVAEMVKYANNAFHGLKVVFANEIGNICKRQGIDSHQVMEIFCMDTKLNLSPYYLKPGFAFGGSCLPKDLRALLYHARRLDLEAPVLAAVLPSNELQVRHGFDLIRQTGSKKVGVLGFSFKAGTDDLRESPLVELVEMMIGKGYQVRIYDRNVALARLQGANRAYIEREIPHIASLMCQSVAEVLADSEVIVIGNKSAEFTEALRTLRPDQQIIDLVRIADDLSQTDARYQGICW